MNKTIVRRLLYQYDPADSTDYGYYAYAKDFINVAKGVKTSGSSTTVSENESGDASFVGVGVGDLLYNRSTGDLVRVTAKASNAQVTVSTAVNWPANSNVQVQKLQGGQTESDGWVNITGATKVTLYTEVATIGSASVRFSLETRAGGQITTQVLNPSALTAVTVSSTTGVNSTGSFLITEGAEFFRLGTIVVTDSTDIVSAVLVIEYHGIA
jgi:hypothetical protein